MPKGKGAGRRKRLERARGAMVNSDGKTPAAAAAAQNPFAQHRNAKKKHEVAGRRVKGGERNMVVARSKVRAAPAKWHNTQRALHAGFGQAHTPLRGPYLHTHRERNVH